jgi:hypothetical protein
MVAKESRFVGEYLWYLGQLFHSILEYIHSYISIFTENHGGSYDQQMEYHKNFMRTQNIAASFATRYNSAMDEAQTYFGEESQAFLRTLPRIQFIEPMVAELMENGTEKNILIERYLEGDYKKVCYCIYDIF